MKPRWAVAGVTNNNLPDLLFFQCISTLAFVKNEVEVLDSPIWIMIINIVALEMLGDKMPKLGGE